MLRANAFNLERQVCQETLRLIHDHSILGGLPVIVVTEAAPGIEASYIVAHIDEYARKTNMIIHYMRELKDNNIGVLKGKDSSDAYRFCLETALQHNILAYSNELMTVHPDATAKEELDRMCEMIRSYHMDPKTNIITSKVDGVPDDILAALNQLLYWIGIFWTTPKYALWRQNIMESSGHRYPFPIVGVRDTRKPRM